MLFCDCWRSDFVPGVPVGLVVANGWGTEKAFEGNERGRKDAAAKGEQKLISKCARHYKSIGQYYFYPTLAAMSH